MEPGENKKKKKKGDPERRSLWSRLTYTTRVTLSFALISAMTAIVSVGVLSFVWEYHFIDYTRKNVQNIAERTAESLKREYEKRNAWTSAALWPAYAVTLYEEEVAVRVLNAQSEQVYDSSSMVEGVNSGPSLVPIDINNTATVQIEVGGEVVGTVRIWVYGSDPFLSQADQRFRENSYGAMLTATAIAIVLSLAIGFLFARSLVRPINRMAVTARAIKEGDLSARTNLTGGDEIARLGKTFDEMADSIEKDRELERRLTTDVAHELRTPLMAIRSTIEAMVDGVFEANEERLETLNAEVHRLGRLVDALLKLFRLENRSKPMEKKKVDVGVLIEGIITTHEAFVRDSGLALEFKADPGVYVLGDADMIRQAVVNLVSNAVRYTPEGGTISVKVRSGDIMAIIAVKDTGIGLSAEEAKMVFSRFWRADAGRTRASGGLGVGLAVVKEIVSRHGGWVNVEGRPDEGATFTIHIPLYSPKKGSNKVVMGEKERAKAALFAGESR